MKAYIATVAGAAMAVSANTASAVELTNFDRVEHTIKVTVGDGSEKHVLAPDAQLKDFCVEGCTIQLDDDSENEFQLSGKEILSIEDNTLFDDTPEASEGDAPESASGFGAEVVDQEETAENEVQSEGTQQ